MPGKSNPSQQPPELSQLMADAVAVAMRIVRNQPLPESMVPARTALLVSKVLSSLDEKEGNHDTHVRIPEARFANWTDRVREEMRRARRIEKQ